jgi:hypothetical protein
MSSRSCVHDCSDLVLYLEGEVTQSRADEITAHVAGCRPCRERLEQHRQVIEALSITDAEVEGFDLTQPIRAASREPPAPVRSRWNLLPLCVGAAAGLALLGTLALLIFQGRSEFGTKGGSPGGSPGCSPAADEQDRWVGLQVYQVVSESPSRLGEELSPGTDLLFSYSNTGQDPYPYLMVFAIDSRGAVHWFYPAFEQTGTDPVSIEISKGERIELRERIRHDYAPGELTIVGLFTRAPLKVSEIEARAGRPGWERLPIEGSAQRVVTTRVKP